MLKLCLNRICIWFLVSYLRLYVIVNNGRMPFIGGFTELIH